MKAATSATATTAMALQFEAALPVVAKEVGLFACRDEKHLQQIYGKK
jgi:hypothetical protein